jgi:hypothetical protein
METEEQTVPSAEASANEPMSFDTALDTLNALDNEPEQQTADPEPAAAEPEVDQADEADTPDVETEADPDADPETELVLHGNAKTRLRNGQEVTIAELKKRWDEAEEYKAQQSEFETRAREFEQKQQAIAAQENYFTQTVAQAKAVLQANFPPKPDEALLEQGDTFSYMEQKAKYDAAVEKWRRLDHAQKVQAQQSEQRQAEARQQQLAREVELLKEALPETRTDEGFKAFKTELLTHAPKEYGISAEELANLGDHRVLRVLKDAIAYRKLQAEKPKAMEKAKAAPPVQVQSPGRRVSTAEKQASTVKQGLDRLRSTGSFDDALSILNNL